MNRFYSSAAPVVILLVLWALPGCITGTSAPSKYYVLNAIPDVKTETVAVSDEEAVIIGVGQVELPNYLDRPQIVTRVSDNKLQLGDFDVWAENLADSIPVIISENLSTLLSAYPVAIIPGMQVMQIDYRVKVDITRMDGNLGGDAVLIARWGIFGEQGRLLMTMRSTYNEPTKGEDYEAYVAAHSLAIAALSRDIAAALEVLLKER